jgi:hypothetical protein
VTLHSQSFQWLSREGLLWLSNVLLERHMDSETWALTVRNVAILAGILLGSIAIATACVVWARKHVYGYGGSGLCMTGVVLLGLSIWQNVEVGMGASGLNFKAARQIVESAANTADEAAKAAKAAEQAAKEAAVAPASLPRPTSPPPSDKAAEAAAAEKAAAEINRAAERAAADANRAAAEAQKHLQEVTKNLGSVFGHRVCIPWC